VKKIISCALALFCSLALGATLNPIQLLNPAGSTSGQVIASTGPTTAPAWSTVTLSGLGGLAKASNLSDLVSASAARTNLGLGTAATASTGTSGATIPLLNGANTWASAQTFSVRPTFNGATPYDSANLTIANYALLASPAFTGTVTAAALTTTGNFTPSQTNGIVGTTTNNNANAGSVGEYATNSTVGTSLTANTTANATSASLGAGDWDVQCSAVFNPGASTTVQVIQVGVNSTSATLPALGALAELAVSFASGSGQILVSPVVRQSLSATTTVYCPVQATFGVSTMTVNGFIRARRVR
jgi:hypothetical protein